ncbi:hypothetical protein JOD50_001906 [Pseudoglutamicibacter cumminsii]|nr:hypothetical protein [Pseudoglutamicibacter cumminsii]
MDATLTLKGWKYGVRPNTGRASYLEIGRTPFKP